MTKTARRLIRTATVLTAVGSFVTMGINLYRTLKLEKRTRQVDKKLDERLENSMDCSDATAVY